MFNVQCNSEIEQTRPRNYVRMRIERKYPKRAKLVCCSAQSLQLGCLPFYVNFAKFEICK